MNRIGVWAVGLGLVGAALAALIFWRLQSASAADSDAPAGRAFVTLAPVEAATISETVTAYGSISASQAGSRALAAPRAVIVTGVLVAVGQSVREGAPLIALADQPATQLAYRQAMNAVSFAERDLARVQRLFDAHLAASDQLDAARKTLADARQAAAAQSQAGAGTNRQILLAPVIGTVTAIPVTAGEHVAADAPLMTLAASNGLVAQLNVEPELARRLAPGQMARIVSSFDPRLIAEGRVTMIGRQVDPITRQIGVTVPVAPGPMVLGAAVKADIIVERHQGFRIPRAAVVYDEAGAHVFVVKAGTAHQTPVRLGAEQGDDVEVAGEVREGDEVAVVGAYQLQDGWPVRTTPR